MRVAVVAMLAAGCGRLSFDPLGSGDGGSGDGGPPPTSCFRGISAGRSSSCAIDANGGVWCWGHNEQRESNPAVPGGYTLSPAHIALLAPAVQIEVGSQVACARLEDNRVECWGDNGSGQLGDGTNVLTGGPSLVMLGNDTATELSLGSHAACVVHTSDGGVSCWGAISNGINAADTHVPVRVPGLTNVHGLAVAHRHACAIDAANAAWCWGRAASGETGPPLMDVRSVPIVVPALGTVAALDGGGRSSCALDPGGSVRCMGDNDLGGLGDGTFVDALTLRGPVIADAVDIGAGSRAACARRRDGSVTCWGAGNDGFLGDGALDTRAVAGQIAGVTMSALSVGYHHVCGLTEDQILCWGRDTEAQLGRGSRAIATMPQRWGASPTPAEFLAMGHQHGCMVQASVLSCWGRNAEGELGDGTRRSRPTPISPSLPFTPVGVAAGDRTTCVFSAIATACWGRGQVGQIGDGQIHPEPSVSPVVIPGLVGVVAMSIGTSHVCALHGAGVSCWGSDATGQLGVAGAPMRTSPTPVPNLTNPTRVAAGGQHSCAIHSPGTVAALTCWGANAHGQLGDGSTTNRDVAGLGVMLAGGPLDVAAGLEHTCAIVDSGQVYCWGRNDGGECGQSMLVDQPLPKPVALPAAAVSLSASARGTCARLTDGRVYCWGVGDHGELGNGSAPASSLPVEVSGLADARLIARGMSAACAALATGQIACWGNGDSGQLGSGQRSDVATPMAVPLSCTP